jgi:hypothetical protein
MEVAALTQIQGRQSMSSARLGAQTRVTQCARGGSGQAARLDTACAIAENAILTASNCVGLSRSACCTAAESGSVRQLQTATYHWQAHAPWRRSQLANRICGATDARRVRALSPMSPRPDPIYLSQDAATRAREQNRVRAATLVAVLRAMLHHRSLVQVLEGPRTAPVHRVLFSVDGAARWRGGCQSPTMTEQPRP